MSEQGLAAWKLPLIVAAIAVSIVAGFYLGGPGLGMAVGGLAAATIVVMAVRHPPRGPILPATAPDSRRRLLVVLDRPLEDGEAVESVARGVAGDGRSEAAEVLLIAPCRNRRLDRWASDLGPGRHRAQRDLVLSAASLAKAGVDAQGRVGDEDLVQMVEDELGSFAATEVILVGTGGGCEELDSRLCVPFRRLVVDPPAHPAAGRRAIIERSLLA
jgi:hypothetical protein